MVSILFRALNHGFNIMQSSESKSLFWDLFSVWLWKSNVMRTGRISSTDVNRSECVETYRPAADNFTCSLPETIGEFVLYILHGWALPTNTPSGRASTPRDEQLRAARLLGKDLSSTRLINSYPSALNRKLVCVIDHKAERSENPLFSKKKMRL